MMRRVPLGTFPFTQAARILLPAVTILLALGVALSGSSLLALIGLGLLGMGIAAVVLLRWPGLGPVLLIPVSFFVPLSIATGSHSEINAPMLVLAGLSVLWLLNLAGDPQRRPLRLARAQVSLLFLGAVFVLALVAGQGSWMPLAGRAPLTAQVGGVGLVFFSIAAFFVAAEQLRDLRWLKAVVAAFLVLGSIFAVGVYFRPLQPLMLKLYQPGSTSSQFWTWLVALAFGQAAFNRSMHPLMRLSLAGAALAAIYSVYVNVPGWQSGWMPAAVALAIIASLRSIWALLVAAGGLAALGPRLVSQVAAAEDYSATTRLLAWQIVTRIISTNPILGLGPANYYWYTPLFSIAGYYGLQFNSHNQYIDLVAQAGLLGLFAFLWFVAEMGWLGWTFRKQASDGFALGYVNAVLGGLGASLFAGMLGDWVLPFVYNVGFVGFRSSMFGWLFMGGLLALSRMASRES